MTNTNTQSSSTPFANLSRLRARSGVTTFRKFDKSGDMSSKVSCNATHFANNELCVVITAKYIPECISSHFLSRKPLTKVGPGCLVTFAVQNVAAHGAVATPGPTWDRSAGNVR